MRAFLLDCGASGVSSAALPALAARFGVSPATLHRRVRRAVAAGEIVEARVLVGRQVGATVYRLAVFHVERHRS